MATDDAFLYFAYGSNLSKARIHINNPSAEFYAVAKLKDYRLIFGKQENWVSNRWHGGVASIEATPGEVVWGVIWKIDNKDRPNLDRQEGHLNKIQVTATTQDGKTESCCVFQAPSPPEFPFTPCDTSPRYKKTFVSGAIEHGLPAYYIDMMKAVKDDGYEGTDDPMAGVI